MKYATFTYAFHAWHFYYFGLCLLIFTPILMMLVILLHSFSICSSTSTLGRYK